MHIIVCWKWELFASHPGNRSIHQTWNSIEPVNSEDSAIPFQLTTNRSNPTLRILRKWTAGEAMVALNLNTSVSKANVWAQEAAAQHWRWRFLRLLEERRRGESLVFDVQKKVIGCFFSDEISWNLYSFCPVFWCFL